MKRRPSGSQLASQVDDLVKVLRVAAAVFPVLAEQARLERNELTGGFPTSLGGADFSNDPSPHYSDPTGEQVVNFRPVRDGACDPSEDLERIARWVGDVQRLLGVTRRLLNQAPAVTLAVVDGRRPSDGRSAEEHAQRRFVRVLADSRCRIGQDHGREDRFGPGELRRGLCDRHRKAFGRWVEARSGVLFGLEESARLVRWQAEVFGCVWRDGDAAGGGAYRDGLRDVA